MSKQVEVGSKVAVLAYDPMGNKKPMVKMVGYVRGIREEFGKQVADVYFIRGSFTGMGYGWYLWELVVI